MVLLSANAGYQLNATSTAEGIFSRFPKQLQEQFAKLALSRGYDMEVIPFDLFIEFIDQVQNLANSRLGRLMASARDFDKTQSRSAGWSGFKQKKPFRPSQAVKQRISRIATHEKIDNKSTGTMQKRQSSPSKFCPLHTDSQHLLTDCRSFVAMPVDDRWKSVRQNRLCFKCLAANHYTRECKSTGGCKKCDRPHHELLHRESKSKGNNTSAQNDQRKKSTKPTADGQKD